MRANVEVIRHGRLDGISAPRLYCQDWNMFYTRVLQLDIRVRHWAVYMHTVPI